MSWHPEHINIETWPDIYAVIEPAMKHADYTVSELIDELIANTAQLWVLRKGGDPVAVAVSELEHSPLGTFVHGRLLAGKDMGGWIDGLIACISRHAHEVGANGISITGRKGWERVLSAKGWSRKSVTMALAFEKEEVACGR